ncbi:cell division control protein 2 homolog 3-like [Coccinella septempunctata]|uniref:cell division control protein 2 homolog 3-like n=1 Tax=Coccinella septempunctata TaxID=41139 RepID=UPI001D0895DF|nr:cell division control protein 2 homolog 3-like [Coccinella septempunctata]
MRKTEFMNNFETSLRHRLEHIKNNLQFRIESVAYFDDFEEAKSALEQTSPYLSLIRDTFTFICRMMEKYRFEAILGEGGFGRVYSARERGQEGQRRAVKEFHLSPVAAREAEFMGLFDHRNIVLLIETLVEPPYLYMVLPLCEEDLRTLLAREGPRRGPSSFFRVVRQIAVGLAECHRQSVLHRDLKPGNVLRQGARFMLADFGVADQLTPYRPLLTGLSSTPMYWSLQQLRQEPYNTAVDLWALGLVAMDVATGEERQRELAIRCLVGRRAIDGRAVPPPPCRPERVAGRLSVLRGRLGENPVATVRWSVGDPPTARPGIKTPDRSEPLRMDEDFGAEGASTTVRG